MVLFVYQSSSLQLPDPQDGNEIEFNLRTLTKRMMNGDNWAYRTAPPLQKQTLNFTFVNRPKILEAINFLRASAGQTISYTDEEGVVWTGKILTKPFEATHTQPRNNTFQLEFEGTHG